MNSKRKIVTTLAVLICVLVCSLATYAFVTIGVNNQDKQTASLTTGKMHLVFADNDNGINAKLNFGESITKKFTIENTENLAASLSLDWKDLLNTYTLGSLTYTLSYSDNEDENFMVIVPETNVPTTTEPFNQAIDGEITVPAKTKYFYNLTIKLNYLDDVDQTADLDAVFNTHFDVGVASKYRHYRLMVNPNGGSIDGNTGSTEYLMKHKDSQVINETPVRDGYTFAGWNVKGLGSTYNNGTFTMGISDTMLTAEWTPNKYQLTIDPNGGTYTGDTTVEVGYNEIYKLGEIKRDGYTFGGWTATGGEVVEDDGFLMSTMSGAKITANWTINDYDYIVYHKKMNTNGVTYTTASTFTDKATFGTTVTPSVNTYSGFTSPAPKTLTIAHDTTTPPSINVVNYEYARNKYNLTLDLDGGTIVGDTTMSVYYGFTQNLGIPEKPGYNFTRWTKTGGATGNLSGNYFTMGTNDATVKANYSAKSLAITFQGNGGTPATDSKTVTYNSTYGTLPTPTYEGFTFLGWYTEPINGDRITDATTVTTTEDQTLYAHWKRTVGPDVTLAKLGLTANSGTPSFSASEATNGGVYTLQDDYGKSYYFRGAVNNNYVKFGKYRDGYTRGYTGTTVSNTSAFKDYDSMTACQNATSYNKNCTDMSGKDMYWRIIRINGDGSIRMIYDGTQPYANNVSNKDKFAILSVAYNKKYDDAKYVGYMYGGVEGVASASKADAQTNETNSTIKTAVDKWYEMNFKDSTYEKYLGDVAFCNDRSTASAANTWQDGDTTLGYAKNQTSYGAAGRFWKFDWDYKLDGVPTFECAQQNDRFTVNDEVKGNGDLTYPIGLITADEIVAAGAGLDGSANNGYYLYKGSWYWSLSPDDLGSSGYANVWGVYDSGDWSIRNVPNTGAVAPVINLSAEYGATMRGSGTSSDPYVVSAE